MMDLPNIWAGLIAFAVLIYVVLDGFDLGIGILFPFLKSERERRQALAAVAPVWDGNETWIVLGGGGLLAAFPLAYGVFFNALYLPIILMLLSLACRGVAIEFRGRTQRWRAVWDGAFAGGSLVAAASQGAILAGLIQGPAVTGRQFSGGPFDWFTGFTGIVSLALVAGYAMLGAAWLVLKSEGALQNFARQAGRWALWATLAFIVVVSLTTPLLDTRYSDRWFKWPGIAIFILAPFPLALFAWRYLKDIRRGEGLLAYLAGIGIFALCYMGLGFSIYPYIVPHSISINAAAAPTSSLHFLLVGACLLLPIILTYTGFAYWVFRGKSSLENEKDY